MNHVLDLIREQALIDYISCRANLGFVTHLLGLSATHAAGWVWDDRSLPLLMSTVGSNVKRLRNWVKTSGNWETLYGLHIELVAVYWAHRRKAPMGRIWLEEAAAIAARYPAPESTGRESESAETYTIAHEIQDSSLIGERLSQFTLRLCAGFKPERISVDHEKWWTQPQAGELVIGLQPDGFTIRSVVLGISMPVIRSRSHQIEGVLDGYFETGSEGTHWVVLADQDPMREGMHFLQEGDHLSITDEVGHGLWSGVIACDRDTGWRSYPRNPKYGQPIALGRWIHWTQRGFSPDAWARFFIPQHGAKFRGFLTPAREVKS